MEVKVAELSLGDEVRFSDGASNGMVAITNAKSCNWTGYQIGDTDDTTLASTFQSALQTVKEPGELAIDALYDEVEFARIVAAVGVSHAFEVFYAVSDKTVTWSNGWIKTCEVSSPAFNELRKMTINVKLNSLPLVA